MSNNTESNFGNQIALVGLFIAIITIFIGVIEPEARCFLGLRSESCPDIGQSHPRSSTSSPSSTNSPRLQSPNSDPAISSTKKNDKACKEKRGLFISLPWIVNTIVCIIYLSFVDGDYRNTNNRIYTNFRRFIFIFIAFTAPLVTSTVTILILCQFKFVLLFSISGFFFTLISTCIYSFIFHFIYDFISQRHYKTGKSLLPVIILISLLLTMINYFILLLLLT